MIYTHLYAILINVFSNILNMNKYTLYPKTTVFFFFFRDFSIFQEKIVKNVFIFIQSYLQYLSLFNSLFNSSLFNSCALTKIMKKMREKMSLIKTWIKTKLVILQVIESTFNVSTQIFFVQFKCQKFTC